MNEGSRHRTGDFSLKIADRTDGKVVKFEPRRIYVIPDEPVIPAQDGPTLDDWSVVTAVYAQDNIEGTRETKVRMGIHAFLFALGQRKRGHDGIWTYPPAPEVMAYLRGLSEEDSGLDYPNIKFGSFTEVQAAIEEQEVAASELTEYHDFHNAVRLAILATAAESDWNPRDLASQCRTADLAWKALHPDSKYGDCDWETMANGGVIATRRNT